MGPVLDSNVLTQWTSLNAKKEILEEEIIHYLNWQLNFTAEDEKTRRSSGFQLSAGAECVEARIRKK
jgi:hypothetical protein